MDAVTSSHPTRGDVAVTRAGKGLVLRALDLHAHRRRQGIATLSVLCVEGEGGGEAAWQRWVEAAGNGLRAVSVPWPRTPEDFRVLECRAAPLWTPPTAPDGGGVVGEGEDDDDALAAAVDLLAARLERGVPAGAWVCGLLVPGAAAAAYLARAPESRAKAYFREGLIGLPVRGGGAANAGHGGDPPPGAARAAAGRALGAAAAPGSGAVNPELLARVGAAADVLDAALARVPEAADNDDDDDDDGARSAAERFLFAMLEAMPGTAGRFALNAPLPGGVRFGPRAAEVDLLAVGPRVAVEVDGYHHFTDAERYRRDRRKDALLQEQGFLVLRFLAADVAPRLETILDAVGAAVARRLTRP